VEVVVKTTQADRRSQRTRQLLNDALLALLMERRYELITVQDIIDRANVGRSTFYAHYEDKEDLLISNFEHMLDALNEHLQHSETGGQRLLPTLELFRHVQEHRYLYKAIVGGRGMELLTRRGQAYFSDRIEQQLRTVTTQPHTPTMPLPFISNYVAGAFVTMLKWWLDNNMPYSPERMDEMFQLLVMTGVRAAVGIAM
jgi:AcrR family transcriptional regulator